MSSTIADRFGESTKEASDVSLSILRLFTGDAGVLVLPFRSGLGGTSITNFDADGVLRWDVTMSTGDTGEA